MKTSLVVAAVLAVVLGRPGGPPASAQRNVPQALDALASVERRFASAAREQGWRAAFLEYFAEDSIALTPEPVSARERLKSRPIRPFSEEELTWEPKAGDLAASGDLGWLTGPSTFIDHTAAHPKPSYGNYLSIWKKQPDGRWRVYIDLGTTVPAPVSFPTWFTHVTAAPRYRDPAGASSATVDLLDADRRFNDRLRSGDAAAVYSAQVVEHGRLHRAGMSPAIAVGTDQIKQWFAANPGAMTATSTAGEAAASGDLGYVYGKYDLAGATPQHGAYVRIWSRTVDGKWLIVADVTAPVSDR
jgi:ketosteroid isomerase-like protein